MRIDKLKLINYRNYKKTEVSFSEGTNVLIGQNAQGKTNLIEAIYFCCVGRSPRTPRDKELIRWESDSAYIRADAVKKVGRVTVEAYITHNENKRISINGMPIAKIGELMGVVNAVFFSPDELRIVKESPSDRRRFLDIDISQLSKAYFYDLSRYNRIVSQRNKLLKSGKATDDTLYIWDVQLAETGAKVVTARQRFVADLAVHCATAHSYLTDGKESLLVEYEGLSGGSQEETKQIYLDAMKRAREKDFKFGYTTQGLHKDDLKLTVDGIDIRSFGSQGQQRTTALSLKLAELEIFAAELGEYPLLILDDVMSELDPERQEKLLQKIRGIQTLITCTHLESDFPDAAIYRVTNGSLLAVDRPQKE